MTAYSSDVITKNANKPSHGESKELQHAFGTATFPVALAVNDTVAMVKLPPYARVVGACVAAPAQIDSNGTPTFAVTVGDAGFGISGGTNYTVGDPARYFTATTVGRAAAGADANAQPIMNGRAQNFLNNQTGSLIVTATVSAVAATFVPNGSLTLRIGYYVDEPPSLMNQ